MSRATAAAPRWNENAGQVDRLHVRPSKQALDRRATTIKKGLAISSRHDKHARAAIPKSFFLIVVPLPLRLSRYTVRRILHLHTLEKHAGGAGEEGFAIPLPTLFEKSGAEGTYRRFKFELLAVIRRNEIPGFRLMLETGRGEPVLRMVRAELTDGEGAAKPASRKPRQAAQPASSAPPAPLPLFGQRPLSETIINRIRRDFPDWDIYALQAEFDAWLKEAEGRTPKDYEAAFYGFVRQHDARNSP